MSLPTRYSVASLTLVVLTAGAGLALWPRLPAEMAIHFTAGGTPDNYVPKAVGVVLLPVVMLATLGILRGAMRLDPPRDPATPAVVEVATMGLMAAIHGVVLAWNLDYPVSFDLVLAGVALWAVALVGWTIARERGLSVTP